MSYRIRVVIAVALPAVAYADPPIAPTAWTPTVSLSIGSFDERLREHVDGTDYDSYRSQYRTVLGFGLIHPVESLPDPRMTIDGHASIGVGVTFQTGDWEVPLREDVTFAYAVNSWLCVRAGLGVGLMLDTSTASRSSFEVAVPLSATFFRTFEVVYRPMLNVPLGRETSPVLGGTSEETTRFAVLPFELALRIHLEALSW